MVNLKSSVLLISSICLSAALCFFKEEENTFMSYDPTQQSSGSPPYGQPQPPAQPPQQPAGTPPPYPPTQLAGTPPYGQPPQPPTAYGQPPQTPAGTPPPYQPTQMAGTPPSYGQSSPSLPPYGQPASTPYGQSNPSLPPYGQSASSPGYGQSSPSLSPYEQGTPSSPSYPLYSASTPVDPYAAQRPADPYAAMQPGQAYQPEQPWAGIPPAYPPPAPKKGKGGLIAIVIVLILALIGGGVAVYIVTRPQPVISVTSSYKVGSTYAGATNTVFKVSGQKFSGSSQITFLLDGNPVPGNQPVQSDSNGNVTANLTVTADWTTGNHTLTAKDAGGYTAKSGVPITIVTPGQANTPGPNGAPPDDASGTVDATVTANGTSDTFQLTVTGSPDGGKVCRDRDNGQPQSQQGTTTDGVAYTATVAYTCSGTYKGGQLSYTETATSAKVVYANGLSCTANVPFVNMHLQGSFSSNTAISGNYSQDAVTFNCNMNVGAVTTNAETGTWTGIAAMQECLCSREEKRPSARKSFTRMAFLSWCD